MSKESSSPISCLKCQISFVKKSTLKKHVNRFHPTEDHLIIYSISCKICGESCMSTKELKEHMEITHPGISLIFERNVFYCMEDFEQWKAEIERVTHSHFMKHRGDRQLSDGRTYMKFFCHRSGTYQPKQENRKRRMKSVGSQKIGKICPANIVAYKQQVEEATEIQVDYQSVHVGHECEVERVPLTKEEKDELAGLMSLGLPKSAILSNLRKTNSPTKRLTLTRRKDLHNICKSYRINNKVTFDQSDAISIDNIVRKLLEEPGNPVFIYKPVDELLTKYPSVTKEEFLLGIMNESQLNMLALHGNVLMIDAMYSINQYGFQLHTLMVIDDNQESFPVAVLYSTRTATETFVPFFAEIRTRIPNLCPQVFMSVDEPTIYDAFKNIFGEMQQYLLCSWNVVKAWNSNLNSKIKDKNVRRKVKKDLMEILGEKDFVSFKDNVEGFVEKLLFCEDTRTFGEYFNSNYKNRAHQWAYCYRQGLPFNTDIKVEQWHKKIKYDAAGKRNTKKLNESLCLVLSVIAKKLVRRILTLEHSKLIAWMTENHKRHDKSKSLDVSSVTEIKSGVLWLVYSSNFKTSDSVTNSYSVAYEDECNCDIRCQNCNVCIHQFTCTCHDYCIRYFMCEHIHLVCQHFAFGASASPLIVKANSSMSSVSTTLIASTDETEIIQNHCVEYVIFDEDIPTSSHVEQGKISLVLEFQNLLLKCQSMEDIAIIRDGLQVIDTRLTAQSAVSVIEHFDELTSIQITVGSELQ